MVAKPPEAERVDALEVALVEEAERALFGAADRFYEGLVGGSNGNRL